MARRARVGWCSSWTRAAAPRRSRANIRGRARSPERGQRPDARGWRCIGRLRLGTGLHRVHIERTDAVRREPAARTMAATASTASRGRDAKDSPCGHGEAHLAGPRVGVRELERREHGQAVAVARGVARRNVAAGCHGRGPGIRDPHRACEKREQVRGPRARRRRPRAGELEARGVIVIRRAALILIAGGLVALAAPAAMAASGIHKIKHVVIIMQENRSFDSYFGTYPGSGRDSRARRSTPGRCRACRTRRATLPAALPRPPGHQRRRPAHGGRRAHRHRRRQDGRVHPQRRVGPSRHRPARLPRRRSRPPRSC